MRLGWIHFLEPDSREVGERPRNIAGTWKVMSAGHTTKEHPRKEPDSKRRNYSIRNSQDIEQVVISFQAALRIATQTREADPPT